ncbi:MAG TPA: di-heme enzyme [Pyrinomonadaceae bacterium]|nr:di-heme enzyme [Pyrinomonadaceae bacterium]
MKHLKIVIIFIFIFLSVFALSQKISTSNAQTIEYKWDLPKGFPTPNVPADNPMSEAKVELGRHLFYDKRLSIYKDFSCATCHLQEKAFTEDKKTSVGSTGEVHPRNSMTLANVAYNPSFNWANPAVNSLERHHLLPIFGTMPIVEMGMEGKEKLLLERVKAEPVYEKLFADAYPSDKEKVTLNHITQSIASFVRTMISGNSPYDKYRYGKVQDAISESAKRGQRLFFSERTECFDCHAGFNLSGTVNFVGKSNEPAQYENNGLYNIGGKGAYPTDNTGLFEISHKKEDMGKFKVPTLRNIELTAPYMHDGSIATLEEVIDHYKAAGRTISEGKYAGKGSENPYKSSFVNGFRLMPDEKQDLIAFLKSLTDTEFINNPKFSNPWEKK